MAYPVASTAVGNTEDKARAAARTALDVVTHDYFGHLRLLGVVDHRGLTRWMALRYRRDYDNNLTRLGLVNDPFPKWRRVQLLQDRETIRQIFSNIAAEYPPFVPGHGLECDRCLLHVHTRMCFDSDDEPEQLRCGQYTDVPECYRRFDEFLHVGDQTYTFDSAAPDEPMLVEPPESKHILSACTTWALETMQVYVRTLTGKTITVNTGPDSTIGTGICQSIQDVEGVPIDQQRLLFEGKQLDDERTLADYNIRPGAIVYLVLGGGKKVSTKAKASRKKVQVVVAAPAAAVEGKGKARRAARKSKLQKQAAELRSIPGIEEKIGGKVIVGRGGYLMDTIKGAAKKYGPAMIDFIAQGGKDLLKGWGDYRMDPSYAATTKTLMSNTVAGKENPDGPTIPRFPGGHGRGTPIVREVVFAQPDMTASFQVTGWSLDITSSDIFPWTSDIAKHYQRWWMDGGVIKFTSQASNIATGTPGLGSVCGVILYDPTLVAPNSMRAMENTEGSVYGKPTENFYCGIECDPSLSPTHPLYVSYGFVGTNRDPRLCWNCTFYFGTSGAQSQYDGLGLLTLIYHVTLYEPIQRNVGSMQQIVHIPIKASDPDIPIELFDDEFYDSTGLILDVTDTEIIFDPNMEPETNVLVTCYVYSDGVETKMQAMGLSATNGFTDGVPTFSISGPDSDTYIVPDGVAFTAGGVALTSAAYVYDGTGTMDSPPTVTFGSFEADNATGGDITIEVIPSNMDTDYHAGSGPMEKRRVNLMTLLRAHAKGNRQHRAAAFTTPLPNIGQLCPSQRRKYSQLYGVHSHLAKTGEAAVDVERKITAAEGRGTFVRKILTPLKVASETSTSAVHVSSDTLPVILHVSDPSPVARHSNLGSDTARVLGANGEKTGKDDVVNEKDLLALSETELRKRIVGVLENQPGDVSYIARVLAGVTEIDMSSLKTRVNAILQHTPECTLLPGVGNSKPVWSLKVVEKKEPVVLHTESCPPMAFSPYCTYSVDDDGGVVELPVRIVVNRAGLKVSGQHLHNVYLRRTGLKWRDPQLAPVRIPDTDEYFWAPGNGKSPAGSDATVIRTLVTNLGWTLEVLDYARFLARLPMGERTPSYTEWKNGRLSGDHGSWTRTDDLPQIVQAVGFLPCQMMKLCKIPGTHMHRVQMPLDAALRRNRENEEKGKNRQEKKDPVPRYQECSEPVEACMLEHYHYGSTVRVENPDVSSHPAFTQANETLVACIAHRAKAKPTEQKEQKNLERKVPEAPPPQSPAVAAVLAMGFGQNELKEVDYELDEKYVRESPEPSLVRPETPATKPIKPKLPLKREEAKLKVSGNGTSKIVLNVHREAYEAPRPIPPYVPTPVVVPAKCQVAPVIMEEKKEVKREEKTDAGKEVKIQDMYPGIGDEIVAEYYTSERYYVQQKCLAENCNIDEIVAVVCGYLDIDVQATHGALRKMAVAVFDPSVRPGPTSHSGKILRKVLMGCIHVPKPPWRPVPVGALLAGVNALVAAVIYHNYKFTGRLSLAERTQRFWGNLLQGLKDVFSLADGEAAGVNGHGPFRRCEIVSGSTNRILGHRLFGLLKWHDRVDFEHGNLIAQMYDHKLDVYIFPEMIAFLMLPEHKLVARRYVTASGFVTESFQAALQTVTLSPRYVLWVRFVEQFVATITFFVQQMTVTALEIMAAFPNAQISAAPVFRCTAPS